MVLVSSFLFSPQVVVSIVAFDNNHISCGENVLFFDSEKNEYLCEITDISKNKLTAKIIKKYKSERFLNYNISVAKCVLKSDDDFSSIQKATELGVKRIIPVISDNCAVNSKPPLHRS